MLWLLVLVLIIFWLGGLSLGVGGGLIHVLLVIVVIVVVYNFLVGRRTGL
jgi:Family of unknown function (DUF5670)